ncbi:CobW family GTP-binding protein [Nocardioides sp. GCM10027113]|uniref:CobW family GTP-binding protein n=1 Tax=unclassified Nocardioides TaxID=2615069 RepID=UPI00360FD7F4
MRTPLVVVTGVDPDAMDGVMVGLAWDLPNAVAVRHTIDPESQVLTRVVSDSSGLLERHEVALEHACVTCALREDILPTLERLARAGRWSTIVSCLPAATEADRLATALTRDTRLARHLRLAGVVTAAGSDRLVDHLLSDDLLHEHGVHSNPDDERGLGEVACAQIEYADVLVLDGDPGREGTDLVRALARPDVPVVLGADQLDPQVLTDSSHQHLRTTAWASPILGLDVPPLGDSRAWRLDLSSPRPFHPGRLLDQIERLGTGRHRSRGCFWLPTRPDAIQEWGGAGGQLSIGHHSAWGRRVPMTRLVLTGVGVTPTPLVEAFEELLVTPEEWRDQRRWHVLEDGLEPWLGDIRDAA